MMVTTHRIPMLGCAAAITGRSLAGLLLVLLVGCNNQGDEPQRVTITMPQLGDAPIVCTTGYSQLDDPAAAGTEAATLARKQLQGAPAKLVLVFDRTTDPARLCQAVSKVFDPKIVFGCTGYGPITRDGNQGTVGVLAISGSVNTTVVRAPVHNDDYAATGRAIGQALQTAEIPKGPGQLLMLIGKCHVPANDELVAAVRGVLGDTFPIVGGAASNSELVYYQGQAYPDSNLGILLTGEFTCGLATQGGRNKDDILNTAHQAVQQAIGSPSDTPPPAVVFAFNCGGRRGVLGQDLPAELDAIRKPLGTVPLFGFYGSGEIGPPQTGQPARGVGFHIAVCALRPLEQPPQDQ